MNRAHAIGYSCGVSPVNSDNFPTNFYPVPAYQYITVSNPPKGSSICYPYMDEALRILLPILKENGVGIIHVGAEDDFLGTIGVSLLGSTDIRQTAYIIKHSRLHIGGDDFCSNLAAIYGIPLVQFFGGFPSKVHAPTIKKGKQFFIDPKYEVMPTFSLENSEETKTILPEEIANAALDALEVECEHGITTKYIGDEYGNIAYDVVPNFEISPNEMREVFLCFRMDYHFDEDFLKQGLSNRRSIVVTDKPISDITINLYTPFIALLNYNVDHDVDINFIQNLVNNGINYNLISSAKGEELEELKFKLFDFNPIITYDPMTRSDVPVANEMTAETKVKATKTILDGDGAYHTKYHWKKGFTINDPQGNVIGDAIDGEEDLWEESRYLYYYEDAKSIQTEGALDSEG